MTDLLTSALQPRSVAIIGASDNIHKIGGRPIYYMQRHGFQGAIYPINPARAEIQGYKSYACLAPWPKYDEAKTIDAEKEIAVQVGGKLKTTVIVPVDSDDETVKAIACKDEKITRLLEGMEIVKVIVIKNKLINLILKPKN